MGLPLRRRTNSNNMNNLHAPTVPSGPTSARAATNGGAATLTFADLQRRKENLEAELTALSSVLDSVCYFTQVAVACARDRNTN